MTVSLSLSQAVDIPVRKSRQGYFYIRYLYHRSQDSRIANASGQDFVAYQSDGRRLAFIICDGVSTSYFGNIAAKFLGERLLEWMYDSLPQLEQDKETILSALDDFLNSLTIEGSSREEEQEISPDLPEPLKQSLERKKERGSQTTFACGYLEVPWLDNPKNHASNFTLAWLGNTEIRAWQVSESADIEINLQADWNEKSRWSTRLGILDGKVHLHLDTAENVRRVLVYSDGLVQLREILDSGLTEEQLDLEVANLDSTPESDDISLIEIEIGPWWWNLPKTESATLTPNSGQIDVNERELDQAKIQPSENISLESPEENLGVKNHLSESEVTNPQKAGPKAHPKVSFQNVSKVVVIVLGLFLAVLIGFILGQRF